MSKNTKSNADHLRELINSDNFSKDEALEFVAAMENEVEDANKAYKQAEDDLVAEQEAGEELKEKADKFDELPFDPDEMKEAFLGLDTMYYFLEKGNIKVQLQLEHWINLVKQQNGAGVEMPG